MNYKGFVECYPPESGVDNLLLFCIIPRMVLKPNSIILFVIHLEHFHGHNILTSTYNFFIRYPSEKKLKSFSSFLCIVAFFSIDSLFITSPHIASFLMSYRTIDRNRPLLITSQTTFLSNVVTGSSLPKQIAGGFKPIRNGEIL